MLPLENENYGIFLSEILNYPLIPRCTEFSLLIDRCSLKELHDIFPTLVNSIFGVPNTTGWGLRTICRTFNQIEFDCLYNFFTPLGPMFRLCYRLLNEPFKFDLPIELLPKSTSKVLLIGEYSNFYTDMVNIDPCRRQISSLSLNAFDYFMTHFLLHGLSPIHNMYPAALAAHNGMWKTLYFTLTADYLCTFLPANPESVVMPTNICGSVKAMTNVPSQPMKPHRSPKYLSLSAISHSFTSNNNAIRSTDSLRQHWRTESVMHLFIDIWLRHNFDEYRELTSSEFIRVVRILVKQLHVFGNSADIDNTSMSLLRKLAQPMMNAQMFTFLRCIISRWPLDSSFTTVLELWLSYIQPWRYVFASSTNSQPITPPNQLQSRFEYFITENLVCYTQILMQLLPRFDRIDFYSIRNVMMLYRILKVFGQPNLADLLKINEQEANSACLDLMLSPRRNKANDQPDVFNMSNVNNSYRSERSLRKERYVYLFGSEAKEYLKYLVKKMLIYKEIHSEHAAELERKLRNSRKGFLQYIKWLLINDDPSNIQQELNDSKKIPGILDYMLTAVSNIFDVELPSQEEVAAHSSQYSWDESRSYDQSALLTNNDISDVYPSPAIMKKRIREVQYMGDPALLPIRSNEVTFMVRLLHVIATKINEMFPDKLNNIWSHSGIIGRIARQVLYPPMTIRTFDKTQGISREIKQDVGARMTLRWFGSYKAFALIFGTYLISHFFCGSSSYGFFILIFVAFTWSIISSFLNDPLQHQ